MKASNHFMWQNAVSFCALTSTSGQRYGDGGQFCAVVAVVNNDAAAAAKAIVKLKENAVFNAGGNERRQGFIQSVIMLDMVKPWITPADLNVLTPVYDKWASTTADLRLDDTDALVGEGIGVILWDIYNGRNPSSARADVFKGMRDAVLMAEGGQWMESTQYNTNTLMLLAQGNMAYRAATGQDVVPGVSATLYDAGMVEAMHVTPDLNAAMQWGDDQWPREFEFRLYQRINFLGSSANPYARQVLNDLLAKYPSPAAPGLMGQGLLVWQTGVAAQPLPTQNTVVVKGMGQMFRRDGQTLAWATGANNVWADHGTFVAPFDVQVYRNGWLLGHPIAYYGVAKTGENIVNGALYAGLSYFATRRMAWTATGTDWSAITGTVRGNFWATTWPAPSDPFLDVGHRVTVLATIAGQPVVIVRDSVKMVDPRTTIRGLDQFYNNSSYQHGATVVEYEGAPWSIWHMPVQPTVAGNRVSWTAATGDPVSLWLDGHVAVNALDETAVYTDGDVSASEKKWQIRVRHTGILWQVWGTGTPTVTRSGNTITVNGKAFTITSSGMIGP